MINKKYNLILLGILLSSLSVSCLDNGDSEKDSNSSNDNNNTSATVPNRSPITNSATIDATIGVVYSGNLPVMDPDGDDLTYQITKAPSFGVLELNQSSGSYTYSAHTTKKTDVFEFSASDGEFSVVGQVTVNTNTRPVVQAISTITAFPQMKRMAMLSATDADDDKIEFLIDTQPTKGSVEIDKKTGVIAYTAYAGQTGQDSFKYKANDGAIDSSTQQVNVVIKPIKVTLSGALQIGFSSNLPLVVIDTDGGLIQVDPKIKGIITIIPPTSSGRANFTTTVPEYSGYMEIDYRGKSSIGFPKKQYGFDTEKIDGTDNDVSLLGMPKHNKWILNAPYSDKSLIRNYVAYNKTRDLGGYSAPRSELVELLVRSGDELRYDGVYLLVEKISRGADRVNIEKLSLTDKTEPAITGGYMLKTDKNINDWFFNTNDKWSMLIVEYPKTKNLNIEQKTYIKNYINDFDAAIFSPDFNNSSHANYYENWLDVDSFISRFLSRELFRDVDSWRISERFSKNRDGKLSMLPVWDFNLSLGNADYGYNGSPEGWDHTKTMYAPLAYWFNRLIKDNSFAEKLKTKWQTMRSGAWSDANLNQFLNDTKTKLNEAQIRNFQRWNVLGIDIWPNRKACDLDTTPSYCNTWEKAVDEHLRVWLMDRTDWMDNNIPTIISQPLVIITEIHYSPANGNEFEFIELYNDDNNEVDISGWQFTQGITHTFVASTTIPAKSTLVIAKDSSKYSDSIQWSSGDLSDIGETLELQDQHNILVDEVSFLNSNPWVAEPNGTGPSLELKQSAYNSRSNNGGGSWLTSQNNGGTPGVSQTLIKPELYYRYSNPVTLRVGGQYTSNPIAISNKGGSRIQSYSINPPIENGLHFETSSGYIWGVPDYVAGQKDYTITATNDAGASDDFVFSIIVTPPTGSTQLTKTASSANTAEEMNGVMNITSSDIELVWDNTNGGGNQVVGLRFEDITIPKDATIKYANITFQADESHTEPTNLIFNIENTTNSGGFTNSVNNITDRLRLGSVRWDDLEPWTTGKSYTTPNLSSLVQSVVNKSSWSAGNAMTFIISGEGHRTAEQNNIRLDVFYQ
ncbi:MAG: hypothetical protein DRQ51_03095 [Gammaproteobacteria bacterium]|nr:MAG: hypothetical protein DRQ51_03095 [Gammaproteobacteria bacterium]